MVTIDEKSGFCFGVVNAISKAEQQLLQSGQLYCLGDIVHNSNEVRRLETLGLRTINHSQLSTLPSGSVLLFRAHGEPPETYRQAETKNINVIDASCPVVLNLQRRIRDTYTLHPQAQIVIFGKQGHAEVIGLQGQTNNTAIVVEHEPDIDKIDFSRDIFLFSQTTKSVDEFHSLVASIQHQLSKQTIPPRFQWFDTICGQVRNRVKHIREFAAAHDVIIFVGGRNSSNGKVLYEHCRDVNPNTLFTESGDELTDELIQTIKDKNIGICGATSTPLWLMQKIKATIEP